MVDNVCHFTSFSEKQEQVRVIPFVAVTLTVCMTRSEALHIHVSDFHGRYATLIELKMVPVTLLTVDNVFLTCCKNEGRG